MAGLKSAEGFIRRKLAQTINLRNTPDITFVMDQSIEYGVNMSRRIDEVMGQMAGEAEVETDAEPDQEDDEEE